MEYPIVIHHDEGSSYGVTVPDIKGCFSAGDSLGQALGNTVEAITQHLALLIGEGHSLPKPSEIESLQRLDDYRGGTWYFVKVAELLK